MFWQEMNKRSMENRQPNDLLVFGGSRLCADAHEPKTKSRRTHAVKLRTMSNLIDGETVLTIKQRLN